MNDIRTRVHTAALVETLRIVRHQADGFEWSPQLDQAIDLAVIQANEAHAAAIDDAEESDRYKRHAEMTVVAKEYYSLLEKGESADPATLTELSDKLDILLEPFSDDPAFTAFCQMKRAASGLNEGKHE
jgi:hypothetical protein